MYLLYTCNKKTIDDEVFMSTHEFIAIRLMYEIYLMSRDRLDVTHASKHSDED